MPIAAAVLIPLLAALLLPALPRRLGPWLAAAALAAAALPLLLRAGAVFDGGVITSGWQWLPAAGLHLTFRLDGLALLFALLVLGIGLLIVVYARYYLGRPEPRLFALLLLFASAMLGVVLSENLLLLVVFWELTSLSSFLLVAYNSERPDARRGARTALAITGSGGLALFAGVLLLGQIAGGYELSVVLAAAGEVQQHPLYPLTLLLILAGAFTKSAQFPFHVWLPRAMAAPTPVSAYLHSATLVKAGVFLLARLFPVLAGTDLWFFCVVGAGLATMLTAAYLALLQHDLKGLLAYSTLSHLGLIMLLLGLGTPLGEVAALFHVINHALFKAALFMSAGIIDHETGTRDLRRLGGLWRSMPYTALLAAVAAAAMAGVPLLNGFLSKEMFFGEAVQHAMLGGGYWLLPVLVTVAGALSFAYSLRYVREVFLGPPGDYPQPPHEAPLWMRAPATLLAAACVLVGLLPALTIGPLLATAAASVLGDQPLPYYSLALWHGVNPALLMSVLALAGGALVYFARRPLYRLHRGAAAPLPLVDARRLFDRLLKRLFDAAARLTARIENGSLQRYAALLIGAAAVAVGWPLLVVDSLAALRPLAPIDPLSVAAAAVLALASLGCVIGHRRRLTALLLANVAGLIVVLAFARFSAPDLALTQLGVEVVTLLLLLLALARLPASRAPADSGRRRWRDLALAGLSGLLSASLVWGVLIRPHDSISDYYLANSVPGGGGANVVNVILVDFRAFDTLGEIIVLAIAALAVAALLDGLRPGRSRRAGAARARFSPLLRTVATPAAAFALLLAAYLFLRGHQLPGGGFVAALVVSLTLLLVQLAGGVRGFWQRWGGLLDPPRLIGAGLLVAALTGLASLALGYPLLTSAFTYIYWPGGKFEIASALAFDLGVLLTVVGVVLLIFRDLNRAAAAAR